jgi:hypothetical protein
MTPRRLARALAVAALAVAALAVAALAAAGAALPRTALAGEPSRRDPPPAAHEPPAGAERVEIHVRFPPWQLSGTFRIETASGAVADEGTARDTGGFSAGDGTVERVLEGARGTLRLRLQGGPKLGTFPPISGRWKLVAATGAYAALAGEGTFTACSAGDPKAGSPYELQTLLGHVVAR